MLQVAQVSSDFIEKCVSFDSAALSTKLIANGVYNFECKFY